MSAQSKRVPKTNETFEIVAILGSALQALDEAEIPGDIGAHVDLAIERLCAFLGIERPVHG